MRWPAAVALSSMLLMFTTACDTPRAALVAPPSGQADSAQSLVYLGRGVVAQGAGDSSGAIAALTRALELDPDNASARMWRSLIYMDLGKHDEALLDATDIIRRDSKRVLAYETRGRIFVARNERAKVAAEANSVVAADPTFFAAHTAAAQMHIDLGERIAAKAILDRAVSELPWYEIYLLRAEVHEFDDFNGRRDDIHQALKRKPDSEDAHKLLVSLQLDSRDYRAAIATASSALEQDSLKQLHIFLHAARGVAYERIGNPAQAVSEFSAARRKASSARELNNLCFLMARYTVSLPLALENCNAALKLAPDSVAAYDSKGFVLLQMRNDDGALVSYNEALKRKGELAESLYGRGVARRRLGQEIAGTADIDAALRLRPVLGEFFSRYGMAR